MLTEASPEFGTVTAAKSDSPSRSFAVMTPPDGFFTNGISVAGKQRLRLELLSSRIALSAGRMANTASPGLILTDAAPNVFLP